MADDIIKNIQQSGQSIYDPIKVGDPTLWIPSNELEVLLNRHLKNLSLKGLPLRTRSKVIKTKVCEAMGYGIPSSFKKTQPRFPGQNLDIYTQKSRNLQIWNEEISPSRRYAIIAIDEDDCVTTVKVVNGDSLAELDTTGTLTQKYQAGVNLSIENGAYLLSEFDQELLKSVATSEEDTLQANPIDDPEASTLQSIKTLFSRLQNLVGLSFKDIGSDQERNRGAVLHKEVCQALGYSSYQDNGQFPDVRNQLLEVKLQTSPTIDLGLVSPDSNEILDTREINYRNAQHSDVRYAIFGAVLDNGYITITHLFLVTGHDFFAHFRKFEGKVLNKKLQIPLPKDFFN